MGEVLELLWLGCSFPRGLDGEGGDEGLPFAVGEGGLDDLGDSGFVGESTFEEVGWFFVSFDELEGLAGFDDGVVGVDLGFKFEGHVAEGGGGGLAGEEDGGSVGEDGVFFGEGF